MSEYMAAQKITNAHTIVMMNDVFVNLTDFNCW